MPVFTPDGTVRLLSVPFDSELRNTLWFPDRTTQTNYWLGQQTQITYYDVNYVKKDNALVVPTSIDQTWQFNYCMYQNSNFTDKWFYAFIVAREWASNNSTRLYLRTDPLQTWMFDWVLKTSFVSRQHSVTDVVGDNEVPEPFSSASAKYQAVDYEDLSPQYASLFATVDPNGIIDIKASMSNGILSGCGKLADYKLNDADQFESMQNQLSTYVENGLASSVGGLQQWPIALQNPVNYSYAKYPSNVDGYVPKNKKILSGLFTKLEISMYGQKVEVDPRIVNGNNLEFRGSCDRANGTIFVDVTNAGAPHTGEIALTTTIPKSMWTYNQFQNDVNLHAGSNGIRLARTYSNRNAGRLTSKINTVSSGLGAVGSGVNAIGSVLNLETIANPIGGVGNAFANLGSAAGAISDTINNAYVAGQYSLGIDEESEALARYAEDLYAPAPGQISSSNGFISSGATALCWGYLVPPANIAKCYDDFLTVYGYAQNQYMVPNLHARQSWTYIKVAELMADCNCPDDDEVMIKAAFNRGIFFWSYTANYGDFSQNNGIV